MNMKLISILVIGLLGIFFGGCASYQGKIKMAQPKKEAWGEDVSPRQYGIRITGVRDKRPPKWRDRHYDRMNGFVPLLFWNYTWGSGPIFTNPKNTDTKDPEKFKAIISKTLKESQLFSKNGPYYDISVDILHFYGSFYQKSDMMSSLVAVSKSVWFWPAGFVSIKLTIVDPKTKEVVSEKVVSNAYLMNSKDENMSTASSSQGPLHMDKNYVHVAMTSMRQLLRRLPYEVEKMVATQDRAVQVNAANPRVFYISRMTNEYDFHECLTVEYSTGNILSGKISRRKLPVVSKPDEWVVLPYLDGHYLNRKEYEMLVSVIKKKYKLSKNGNATCVIFQGAIAK